MLDSREMVLAVHARMDAKEKRQTRRSIAVLAGFSGVLTVALGALIAEMGGGSHRIAKTRFAGTSMLADGVGGYVLAAVLAFMMGVVVTVFCIRVKGRGKRKVAAADRADAGRIPEEKDGGGRPSA